MAIERITRIEGRALPIHGHNIDTDRIIPARFLRSVSFEGLEQHLFEDDLAQAGSSHPLANRAFEGATLMFVNANFGCGSSREHAPQAIRRRGIRAVIGESFSEIFFGNSLAIGLPCLTAAPDDLAYLQQLAESDAATHAAIDLNAGTLQAGGRTLAVSAPRASLEALVTGAWDATGLLLEDPDAVKATAASLPYVSGF